MALSAEQADYVPGLRLERVLGRGAHSVVWSAALRDPGARLAQGTVVVKVAMDASAEHNGMLRREARALARLRHPNVLRLWRAGSTEDGRAYLVLDAAAYSLADELRRGPLSIDRTVQVACGVASALEACHDLGLVHRDIKPGNLLVAHPHRVLLADFGLSLDLSQADLAGVARVAGSLLYAAPEQTGMLRRPLDGRADLYALGIVLFECLTGRPPFSEQEGQALLQLHATARPSDVRAARPEVPEPLARLVAKLLLKDPDDRYADASKLLADLATLDQSAAGGAPSSRALTIGASERPPFGRDREVREIRRAISKLHSERGGTLCVTGPKGSGKRKVCEVALAGATSARVLATRAADAEGASFGPFRALVSQLVALASAPASTNEVHEILARHGGALARLFPDLRGLAAPSQELSADLAVESLVRALGELATRERPCVILVEAADRLTAPDRAVLRRLHTQTENTPLLILCTAESNSFLDDTTVREIQLGPLALDAVERQIRHALGPLPFGPRFTELAATCSAGNPGVLTRLIGTALHEGIVDTDGERWTLDEARFLALDAAAGAELSFVEVSKRLAPATFQVLRHASVLGRRFDAAWLSFFDHADEVVSEALWEGVQRRLLILSSDGEAVFAHASLHELLARDVPEEERKVLLSRVVSGLEARSSLTRSERALLARAHFATVEVETAHRAWERCLDAGLSELEAFAFVEARILLDCAAQVAELFALETDFRLHRALGQLEAQAGRVDAAVARFRLAIARCSDRTERATMHLRCAELRFFNEAGHTGPMREHLELAWADLGSSMPRQRPWTLMLGLFFALCATFLELTGMGRTERATPRARARIRLCELTGIYYFWTHKFSATLSLCMQGWFMGRLMGPCREVVNGLAGLGNFFVIAKLPRRGERLYAEARAVAQRIRDPGGPAYVTYMQGVAASLTTDIQRSERLLAQCVERHAGELDISYLAQAAANLATALLCRGEIRRAEEVLERVKAQVRARFDEQADLPETCVAAQMDVLIQTNRAGLAEPCVQRMRHRISDPLQDPLGWLMRHNAIALYEFARGSADEVVDQHVNEADKAGLSPRQAVWLVSRIWVAVAHMRLGQWTRASPKDKPHRAGVFFASMELARKAPQGPYLDGHLHVLRAAELWLRDRPRAAEQELVRAEDEARTWASPRVLMEVHALRAHMLHARGRDPAARMEAMMAVALAEHHGMESRAREIEAAFTLRSSQATQSHGSAVHTVAMVPSNSAQRERDALLEVTIAASREIDPRAQAAIVLDRLIALLGAERGLIFADDERGDLQRLAGRSAQREDLPADVVHAQSLVRRVRETSLPLVLSGTEQGAGLGSESMVASNLRSMVCAPVRLGEQTRGVIYLDSSLARGVFTRRDLEILEAMGSQIALTQEMARGARTQVERQALEKDLQLSGAVQSLFLPTKHEATLGDLSIAAAYVPVSHSGGDFWSYDIRPDQRCWLLVADATGHGAGAAMVTAVLAGCYRSLVDRGADSLAQVVTDLHMTMASVLGGRHAATLTALELQPNSSKVRIWSAGGPPLLRRDANGAVESLLARGSPLGTAPWSLGELTVELPTGARLLVVTDGVLEMPTVSGRELGSRRLNRLFAQHGGLSVADARGALLRSIMEQRGSLDAEDDLTLLVVGRD